MSCVYGQVYETFMWLHNIKSVLLDIISNLCSYGYFMFLILETNRSYCNIMYAHSLYFFT